MDVVVEILVTEFDEADKGINYIVHDTSARSPWELEYFYLSHVEELEAGGDANVDGYGGVVVIWWCWS